MPHTRFNITNDKICSTIIYRLQIFVIPAFQTFFCHQMAGIQFLFTANQIVSMSYCHENQSFITYRLFFQTKSDKIYSRVVTIPHIHSDILLDTQKSCFIRFRAAFLVFSVNFVHKNTSRNKQHLAPQAVHLQISGKNFSTVMPSTMTFWQ